MALPVSHYFCLRLLITDELDVKLDLSVEVSFLVDSQSALEKAHLIYIDFFVLDYVSSTTLRIINLRVKKLLLVASISEVLEGSKLLRIGLDLFSGSDLNIRKGTP